MNYNDSQEACQQTRWFLRTLALLPRNSKSSLLNRLFLIEIRVIHMSLMLWIICSNAAHMILRESNKNKKIILIGPMSYAAMCFFKFCAIYYRGKLIIQCLEHINDDWRQIKNEKHPKLMEKNMQWGKRTTLACAILMYTGGFCYNFVMPASIHIITRRDNDSTRMPVFPGYDVFFDCHKSPIYEIIFVTFFYGAFIGYTVTICSNHLAILFVSHILGQLEILEEYFSRLTAPVNLKKQSLRREIATIVNHHCRIAEFSKAVKKVLYEICLTDVLISTLLICMGEYSILQMWKNEELVSLLTYVVLTLGLTISPLIFCWISEIMSTQFPTVSQLAYNTEWCRFSIQDQKCLILILIIAEYPQKIDAGVVELSFVAFLSILKTAVGYFQMLRTMT